MLPFDLPTVARKKVSIGLDGGMLWSDSGVLLLREVERRLGIAARLPARLKERSDIDRIEHRLDEMLRRQRLAVTVE